MTARMIEVLASFNARQWQELADFAHFVANRRRILGLLPIVTTAAA